MNPVLVEAPSLFPHACIDGRQDGPVVLTGRELPGFGVVYLSQQMLRDSTRLLPALVEELAGEIGWVAPDHGDAVLEDRDRRIAELEGRLAALEPVERALIDAAERFEREPAPRAPRPRSRAAA